MTINIPLLRTPEREMDSLLLVRYHYLALLSIRMDLWDFHSPKPVNELVCAFVYMDTGPSPQTNPLLST